MLNLAGGREVLEMASDLNPSTAAWTTSNVLAACGENLTVAQQNAGLENGGWLFASQPVCWNSGTKCDFASSAAWIPLAGTAYLWKMQDHDYFTVGMYTASVAGSTYWRALVSEGGTAWSEICSGTAGGNVATFLMSSSGPVSNLCDADIIEVVLQGRTSGGDAGAWRNPVICSFGADTASSNYDNVAYG